MAIFITVRNRLVSQKSLIYFQTCQKVEIRADPHPTYTLVSKTRDIFIVLRARASCKKRNWKYKNRCRKKGSPETKFFSEISKRQRNSLPVKKLWKLYLWRDYCLHKRNFTIRGLVREANTVCLLINNDKSEYHSCIFTLCLWKNQSFSNPIFVAFDNFKFYCSILLCSFALRDRGRDGTGPTPKSGPRYGADSFKIK